MLPQIIEGLQRHLVGGDRIAGLLEEAGLDLREVGVHGRIERIEILAEAQAVELVAAFLDRLGDRSADAAAFVAQEREQTYRSPAQLLRDVKKGRHIERRENHGEAGDEHDSRPDDLPWADFEIQARHPVASEGQDEQPSGHEIARIDSAREEHADDQEHDDRENSRG